MYTGNWHKLGVSEHLKNCHRYFDWMNVTTLRVDSKDFTRKVREAIDIQHHQTGSCDRRTNLDDGQYIAMSFWKPSTFDNGTIQLSSKYHEI